MKTWDEIELLEKESLPLWKNRDFIIIYLALFISGAGDGISKIALLKLSYQFSRAPGAAEGSAAAVGLFFACLTLPGIFAGFLSGALADRFSKKKVFVTARICLGTITSGFVLAYLWESLFLIYVLAFLTGTFVSFQDGPFRAYLSEIFPADRLSNVNTAVSSARSLSVFVGYAAGGVIMAAGNVTLAFLIVAAVFFIAAIMMGFLPLTLPKLLEGSLNVGAVWRDIKSGIIYLVHSPLHRFLAVFFVSLFGIYCFGGGLIMPFCKKVLAAVYQIKDTTALAFIQGAFGLGAFISGFFIPAFMKRYGYLRTLLVGAFLCVMELLAFAAITNLYALVAITTITAAFAPMLLVPLFTFMQEKTEPRFMGRAMGAMDTAILFAVSFSFFFGGVLGDVLGVRTVFFITGITILGFALICPFLPVYKRVRQIEMAENSL
jgi:MFS family permease